MTLDFAVTAMMLMIATASHDHEKDHDQPVRRDQHVVEVMVAAQNAVARRGKLDADQHRHDAAEQPADHRQDQVKRPDPKMNLR